MAIGRLQTEADLQRFVETTLDPVQLIVQRLRTMPVAVASVSAGQTFTTGVAATVRLDFSSVDQGHGGNPQFDNANDRMVCRIQGTYAILGYVEWPASGGGVRGLTILKNGAAIGGDGRPGTAGLNQPCTALMLASLAVGDTVHLTAIQNAGGNLTTTGVGAVLGIAKVA